MPFGFHDRILKVDLSTGRLFVDSPGEAFYRRYLGGRALIAYYLAKEMPPQADPLGPDNLLIFAPGVATGATISGPGRNGVGAKSPLTGAFGSAEVGGFWGAELKRAGFDAVVVRGRAELPVYLWIQDGKAEIREAGHLWGKTVGEADEALKQELGDPHVRTALIGPAGERMVRYATVVNDRSHFAGRGGLGAVMGAKHLKGIACRGPMGKSGLMAIKDQGRVSAVNKWMGQNLPLVEALHKYGTAGGLLSYGGLGNLPTYNFQEGSFPEGQDNLSGERMAETILVRRETCYACAVRCKRAVELETPYRVSAANGGPEYETLAMMGSNLGIGDLELVAKASELSALYGLDSISLGASISWAMECFQNGLLTTADTGGIEIRFGDKDLLLPLVDLIVRREGVGDLLAEGAYRASRIIGRGTEAFVVHVKGQDFPAHEPRTKHGLGLGFAVSPTGADHMHNLHDSVVTSESGRPLVHARMFGEFSPVQVHGYGAEKLRLLNHHSNWRHALDSMVMCHFLPYDPGQMVEIINGITGWDMDIYEMHRVGERAATMARTINACIGLRRDADSLPPKMFKEIGNSRTGKPIDPEEFQAALTHIYRMNGWDPDTGIPTPKRLRELGEEWLIDLLRTHVG